MHPLDSYHLIYEAIAKSKQHKPPLMKNEGTSLPYNFFSVLMLKAMFGSLVYTPWLYPAAAAGCHEHISALCSFSPLLLFLCSNQLLSSVPPPAAVLEYAGVVHGSYMTSCYPLCFLAVILNNQEKGVIYFMRLYLKVCRIAFVFENK